MVEEADATPVLAKLEALLQRKAHAIDAAKMFLGDFAARPLVVATGGT